MTTGADTSVGADTDTAGPSAAAPAPMILEVRSGPHRGAVMSLEPERRYAVGNGGNADILLSDDSLEPTHLWLDVGDGVVAVVPADGDVAVDGHPLDGDASAEPRTGAFVAIGDTRFAVGRRGRLPASVADPADEAAPADPASAEGANRAAGTARRKGLYLAGALGTFGAFVALVFSQSPRPLEAPAEPFVERVAAAVADLPIEARTVAELPDGAVVLGGYVASEEERRQVAERIEGFERQVSLQVWSETGLLDSANRVLASLGLENDVAAVSVERGDLVFEGDVDAKSTWDKALNALHEDIAGLGELDDTGVHTLAERADRVRDAVREAFPGADLAVAREEGRILIRGRVPEAARGGFERLLRRLGEEAGDGPAIVAEVAEVPEPKVELDIRWVSAGPDPYVVTTDGARYMEGGRFDNGYVIKAIHSDRLVLSRDGRDTDYPL